MRALEKMIDKVYETGKLPKGISLSDFRVLEDVYTALKESREAEFINQTICDVLTKCRIKTKTHGIGWIAYR